MNYKDRSFTSKIKIILVAASFIAIIFGLNGLYSIYVNNKTDSHGHGEITVTSCNEVDRDWKVYSCTGDYFSTGGGMVHNDDVTVTVFGRGLKSGDVVKDVYPPGSEPNETASYFVTGRERASVLYNIPSLTLVFIGMILPLFTIAFFAVNRDKKNS